MSFRFPHTALKFAIELHSVGDQNLRDKSRKRLVRHRHNPRAKFIVGPANREEMIPVLASAGPEPTAVPSTSMLLPKVV